MSRQEQKQKSMPKRRPPDAPDEDPKKVDTSKADKATQRVLAKIDKALGGGKK